MQTTEKKYEIPVVKPINKKALRGILQQYTIDSLTDMCESRGLSVTGNKQDIINALVNST
jgi:hypothetical protein